MLGELEQVGVRGVDPVAHGRVGARAEELEDVLPQAQPAEEGAEKI